jgi:hypothetical protein
MITAAFPVTKLDAARRQLEMAVELFFMERDPVATHTLTEAVYQILSDINKHRGGEPLLHDLESLKKHCVPGKEKILFAMFREAENFFKHADKDPEGVVRFSPQDTEFSLWESCIAYTKLTGEQTPIMKAMNAWFQLHHSEILLIEDWRKDFLQKESSHFLSLGKPKFFKDFVASHLMKAL